MSRRYWLPIFAVVGLISGANAQQALKSHRETPRPAVTEQTPRPQSQPAVPLAVQNSLDGMRAALEATNKKGEKPEEKRKAEEDRQAQLSMASSARQMFVVGIVETGVTFAGVMLVLGTLLYTKRAADAARDAVNVSREIGQAQVRAYLHIKSLSANFYGGIKEPAFSATMVNTGDSPAHAVVCVAQVRYDADELHVRGQVRKDWRDALGKSVPTSGESDIPFASANLGLSPRQEERSLEDEFGALMGVRVIFSYRDVFEKYWTDEAYFVGFLTPNADKGPRIFRDLFKVDLKPVGRPQNWANEEA